MRRIKIAVITCMHGRPQITEVFLRGLAYTRSSVSHWADLRTFAAITAPIRPEDQRNADLCREYGVTALETDNFPVGHKWNQAIELAKDYPFDYALIMGSDDLIAPELLTAYQAPMLEGVPFIGVKDLFFVNSADGRAVYFSYPHQGPDKDRTVGAGRVISRAAIEKANWILWPPTKNNSLDMFCDARMDMLEIERTYLPTHRAMLIDLKSPANMWDFERFTKLDGSITVELSDALWWVPNDLARDIVSLQGGTAP